MHLCVLLRDVISSQKLAFSAGHCGKINLLLKVSKLVIIVTDWLFKTLPWLLFISIFYDSPWSIFTAIEQIKNDQSNQALCWDKFGSDVTYLAVHETVNNIPVVISFSKKLWSWVWTMAYIFSASVECKCFTFGIFLWTISQFISDINDFVGLLQLLALRHLLYLKKMFFKTPFNV